MTDKDIKIKSLESELDNRQQQIIVLQTDIVNLQQRIDQNADVVELSEKIKMLETQNVKLIEKNQSDVVDWKTREHEFKQQLKLMQDELSSVKSQLDQANELLRNSQPEESRVEGLQQTIRDLQSDHNDLRSINDKLLQNVNQMSIQNENLKRELQDSEDQKKQLQLQIQDLNNKHQFELEQLRDLLKNQQNHQQQKDTLNQQQLENLKKLQLELQNKLNENDEEFNQLKQQRDNLLLENNNLKLLNEKEIQEISLLTQQIKSQNQQIQTKDKLIQELENKVNNEHNLIAKQQQNVINLEEKLKEQSIQFEKSLKDKDNQILEIKKTYEIKIGQIEKDYAIILNQLQETNDQNKELLRQIRLLEIQCKEATNKQVEKDKKLIDALERMKKIDLELKALMKSNSVSREQIIYLESELSRVKEQNRLLQREKAEIKEKLDFLIAQQNRKGKVSEIEGLRKQVNELQTELELIKDSYKTAQTQLKSTTEYISYCKGRVKKLDFENQTLIESKLRLESLFQELLESTKTKKSVYRNQSEVSIKSQQSKLIYENSSSIFDPTSERLTAKTSTNQVNKSGDVRSLFKRPIQVLKIRSIPKQKSQHDIKKSEDGNELNKSQQDNNNNNSNQVEESILKDESQQINPKNDSEIETL
ncbi:unnamed protein product [Paramecium sonneborni]|uniref:Uncharacterized protein n=1 Tax=Paramecium sonneborni TaxID=65129 RepID=A0A8S1R024_9CILI|nr:unnamed protein product [Paramecium sonneborni]